MRYILTITDPHGKTDRPGPYVTPLVAAIKASLHYNLLPNTRPGEATKLQTDLLAAFTRAGEGVGAELRHELSGYTYRIDQEEVL